MTTGNVNPVEYAERSSRLIGQIVDGVFGAAPMGLGILFEARTPALATQLMAAGAIWWLAYFFLADGLPGGQSFGKRMLNMRVVNVDNGAPCSFGQSLVRNLLLAMLGPLDWIFIFGEQHQRLGDKAANTIVITAFKSGTH